MSDPRDATDRLINETEAAELLKLNVKTLRNYRALKRGPAFVKVGRSVRYWVSEVLAYARSADTAGMLMLFAELFRTYA